MPSAIRPRSSRAARLPGRPMRLLIAAVRMVARWRERYRQRCDLGELDDRLLDDVGLTRRQAREECGKPFWR